MTLYHRFDVLTSRGIGLAGYQVICRLPNGGAIQPIYSDINGTPIVSVSGIANTAVTDELGNFSYFVQPSSVYDEEYYTPAGAFAFATRSIAMLAGVAGPSGPPGADLGAIGTFVTAANFPIPPGALAVRTSGFAATGDGANAAYVKFDLGSQAANDSFVAANPLLSFKNINGLYYRFTGTVLFTSQAGAVGIAGTNDQPAGQACLSYAAALGILTVLHSFPTCEAWCPQRTPNANDASGTPFVITSNLHFGGVDGGTTITLKNSQGGPKTTYTQVGPTISGEPNHVWQGGGIKVVPASGKMNFLKLSNLIVDGGLPYTCANYTQPTAAERAQLNLTDKGIWIQDVECDLVQIRNCQFRNFGGEVYYIGGTGVYQQDIQDSVFEASPQCAMNPGSPASIYFRNVRAGKSYQNEMLGGMGGAMPGCHFYQLYSMFLSGGPDPTFLYNYSYPARRTDIAPPFVDLTGVVFESIGSLGLSSFMVGEFTAIDTSVELNSGNDLSDVNLRIHVWADRVGGFEGVGISGPASATVQIQGAPAGTYVPAPRDCRVEVICHQTELAQANGNYVKPGLRYYGGLIDPTCQFIVDGTPQSLYDVVGTVPAGGSWPRIDRRETARPVQTSGASSNYPSANFTVDMIPGDIEVSPSANGSFVMTATANFPLVVGQRTRLVNMTPVGRAVVIPANPGGGIMLSGPRVLDGFGSNLILECAQPGVLVERGYSTQHVSALSGSGALAGFTVANGARVQVGSVNVNSAAIGDVVLGVSASVALGGLETFAEMGNGNATIYARNDTGASATVAGATWTVFGQKAT